MLITNIFAVYDINQTLLCDRPLSNSCEFLSLTSDRVPLTIQQTVVESEVTPSKDWHRQRSSSRKPTEAGWSRYALFSLSFTWPLETSLYNHYLQMNHFVGQPKTGRVNRENQCYMNVGPGKHFIHTRLLFGYRQKSTKNIKKKPHPTC